MKRNSFPFFLINIVFFLIPCSLLMAAPLVILEEEKEEYPLGLHLEYLEDQTGELSIEDVSSSEFNEQFMASRKGELNFGITSSVYWIRFQLQVSLRDQEQWLLEIQSVNWQLVQCYVQTDDDSWFIQEGGRRLSYDRSIFMNNNTVFRLPQPTKKDQMIYLRFKSSSPEMNLNLHLRSLNATQKVLERKLHSSGMFHGVLIIMAVYNVLIYLSIREKSYLFYALYICGLTVFFMIDDGVGIQWYWQTPNWLISRIEVFSFCTFEVFFLLFVKSFLKTKQNTPKMDHMLSFAMFISIGAMVVFFFFGLESNVSPFSMVTSILLMIATVMTVAILCVKKGYTPARYFLLASTTFVAALAITAFQALYFIPGYDPEMLSMKVGAILEALLYAFALAYRLKYERRLKEESQQRAIDEQIRMTRTFEKFVPTQFLRRISDQGIEHIELGRAQSDSISILFSDIRAFTHLSETMSPQALMNFLNEYFSKMNKPIHAHQGFIDKFIGDAIMALFDLPEHNDQEEAMSAVQAAIGMQFALKEFNQQRVAHGNKPITIGIGVHSGSVIIGTVGSADRMDSTVLGDVVNLASRLEGLTKQFQAQIILSSKTWHCVKDDESLYWRALGNVRVKGRDQPERIYEIFNADEPYIRDKKLQILKPYHEGVRNYFSQNWDDAIEFFEECLKIYPQDIVSQKYLGRCMKFKNESPGKNWNGVLRLKEKFS